MSSLILLLILCILILIIILAALNLLIRCWIKWKEPIRSITGVCFVLLVLGIISFFQIKKIIENKEFYQYRSHIMKTFDYVYDVGLENIGPTCIIAIYVKDEQVDYETIEPIFIEAMKEIYQESLFPYLVKKQEGDILKLDIFISNSQRITVHRFVSIGDFDVWEYEKDRSKKFMVSDYVE